MSVALNRLPHLAARTVLTASLCALGVSTLPSSPAAALGGPTSTVDAASASASTSDASQRAAAKPYKKRAYKLVKQVKPQPENRRDGYVREAFPHWLDTDGDCLDTRQEVLVAESWRSIEYTLPEGSCRVVDGEWLSSYDNEFFYGDGSDLDVDHVVPLAEAWDSGAWAWDLDTRTRFANDLDDVRSLRAVSASSNRSKGDKDPAEWMPVDIGGTQCGYADSYLAVKIRWGLSVDAEELEVLREHITSCDNTKIKIIPAAIGIDPNATDPGVPGDETPDPEEPEEPAGPSNPTAKNLWMTHIVYDPFGAAADGDANNEVATIINLSAEPSSTAGVVLRDGAGHTFALPALTLPGYATYKNFVHVYSGAGTNHVDPETGGQIVYANWGHVWNNTGDSFTLIDAEGTLIHEGSWVDKDTADNDGYTCWGCSPGN